MGWLTLIWVILVWYVIVQIVAWAVLPLTLRVLRELPDRGYSLAKISGVLVVGVVYWLSYSYGLIRNERGGVWIVLFGIAAASWFIGWADVRAWWHSLRLPQMAKDAGELPAVAQEHYHGRWRALLVSELVFALPFVAWAVVRSFDPDANHTEQPMDLMFMNSIWASPTYPPHDAWLAGYGISYYYLGYWLLITLARLANTSPNVAYNVGQAVWYGLLWVGCFGVVMNLLAWRFRPSAEEEHASQVALRIPGWSLVGGVLGGICVAFTGNLLVILEWLYAQGMPVGSLAQWIGVNQFPERASQTGQWFISYDWWWWRSSRVIADHDLFGNYTDVIDEFPMFSYLLGDNHPHLLAMPVVLLVVGLALNLLLLLIRPCNVVSDAPLRSWHRWLPLGGKEIALYLIALGSLVFLNTWDYPPYWLLLVAIVLLSSRGAWQRALVVGAALVFGTVLLYLPYFFTAQSQAAGIAPNVFNPTRLPQFLVMFGGFLPAVVGMVLLGWRLAKPRWVTVGAVGAVVLGVPIGFLALSVALSSTGWAQEQFARMELPPDVTSYASLIVARWLAEPWTLLLVGMLLTFVLASVVMILQMPLTKWASSADLIFVLLIGGIGLALVYAPEFVYLRDHFGTRMNTVFKFYYQGWLLLGLASAYVITVALHRLPRHMGMLQGLSLISLVLVVAAMIFPFAGVYAKTGGFARETPTLDATAYVAQSMPDVKAAIEWVRLNTTPDEVVLEAKGNSYSSAHNRISTMTGRATLLGWDGHESQWRGRAYGTMAQGRPQAIETVYRTGSPEEINAVLAEWDVDYVFVGPAEIDQYGITSIRLEELGAAMDTVFSRGQVRIFRRREG